MKNFFKIFIFFMIIFLSPKVFASEIDISSKVRATYNGTGGTYTGLENYLYGQSSTYSIGTRYNGRLSKIDFYLNSSDWDWNYNTTYTVTLNMATEDWRNQFMQIQAFMTNDNGVVSNSYSNLYVSNTFRFVSYKKIRFNIRTSDVMLNKIKFTLWSGGNSYYFTGVNNWNLSSITIADQITVLPTPMPNQPTPTPIPDSSQSIIDNQTQNTQDIIDNQTQNTTDIIENNNQNTQIINDSLNSVCKSGPYNITDIFIDKSLIGKELKSDGSIGNWSSAGITKYLSIKPNEDYTIYFSGGSVNSVYYCLYTADKTVVSCSTYSNRSEINFNSGQYVSFLRLTVPFYRIMSIKGPICNDFTVDAQNDTTNAINNLNDTMKNDNIDNGLGGSFFSDFDDQDFGLSSIITIPLNTIQSLTSQSCVALNIPIPFTNSSVPLPCMTQVYEQNVPTIYNLWKIVSFGIIAYFIAIDIFHMVKGFKDPESDKVEVLDL